MGEGGRPAKCGGVAVVKFFKWLWNCKHFPTALPQQFSQDTEAYALWQDSGEKKTDTILFNTYKIIIMAGSCKRYSSKLLIELELVFDF